MINPFKKPLTEKKFTLAEFKEMSNITAKHARSSRPDYSPAQDLKEQLSTFKEIQETFSDFDAEQREQAIDALKEDEGDSSDMIIKALMPMLTKGITQGAPSSEPEIPQEQAPVQNNAPLPEVNQTFVDMAVKRIPHVARNAYKTMNTQEQQAWHVAIHNKITGEKIK